MAGFSRGAAMNTANLQCHATFHGRKRQSLIFCFSIYVLPPESLSRRVGELTEVVQVACGPLHCIALLESSFRFHFIHTFTCSVSVLPSESHRALQVLASVLQRLARMVLEL